MGRGVDACASRSEMACSTAASASSTESVRRADRLGEPLALGGGRLECHARAPERFAALGEPAVELLQRRDGLSRVDLRQIEGLALLGEREPLPLDRGRDLDEALLGGIPLGDELELAAPGAGAAAQHVLGQHVALARDDGQVARASTTGLSAGQAARAASRSSTTTTRASSPRTPSGRGDERRQPPPHPPGVP